MKMNIYFLFIFLDISIDGKGVSKNNKGYFKNI